MSTTDEEMTTGLEDGAQLHDALDDIVQAYRHQNLQSQLDTIAQTMEKTLLQVTIAERLFDTSLSINPTAQSQVESAQSLLEEGAIPELDEDIDDIRQSVERANSDIENRIQELRINKLETVTAMRRINEEIGVMDQARLSGLESLLDNWDWKAQVQYDEDDSYEKRKEAARTFGDEMSGMFSEAKDVIGQEFDDDTVQTLLKSLLNDEGITITDISREEIQALVDSDIGNYIELTLGGDDE